MKLPEPVAWELLFNSGHHDDFTIEKGEANEYGENKIPLYTESQMRQAIKDAYEECAKLCEEYSEDKWNLYKGREPYTGFEEGRADKRAHGQSDGADDCAEAIRNLKEQVE